MQRGGGDSSTSASISRVLCSEWADADNAAGGSTGGGACNIRPGLVFRSLSIAHARFCSISATLSGGRSSSSEEEVVRATRDGFGVCACSCRIVACDGQTGVKLTGVATDKYSCTHTCNSPRRSTECGGGGPLRSRSRSSRSGRSWGREKTVRGRCHVSALSLPKIVEARLLTYNRDAVVCRSCGSTRRSCQQRGGTCGP